MKVTSLWFATPKRWFLIGYGQPKGDTPDKINSKLVQSELDELIQEITSTTGTIRCQAHQLVVELQWSWQHPIRRRQTHVPEADIFSGQVISKEAFERTYTELQLYQLTWSEANMPSKVLFDMLQRFCLEKGYQVGGGTATDRQYHFAELMVEDLFAAKLMKETMVDRTSYYETICQIAHTLSKGKKRKRILD